MAVKIANNLDAKALRSPPGGGCSSNLFLEGHFVRVDFTTIPRRSRGKDKKFSEFNAHFNERPHLFKSAHLVVIWSFFLSTLQKGSISHFMEPLT